MMPGLTLKKCQYSWLAMSHLDDRITFSLKWISFGFGDPSHGPRPSAADVQILLTLRESFVPGASKLL